MNDLLQEIVVAVVLAIAAIWVIAKIVSLKRVRTKCDGCPLADNCKSRPLNPRSSDAIPCDKN